MVTSIDTVKKLERKSQSRLKAVTLSKKVPVGNLFVDFEPIDVKEVPFKEVKATLKIYRAYYKNEEVAFVRYILDFEGMITHEEIISAEDGKALCK
ncbi:hypothetical protein A3K01_01150 [candidate division WWE3 bacterium RIFOXYD1_FULL_43_17]|nr:MAG: hypothetical protein UV26_C0003G0029 [candidate division WWE3 bacterium GW2011_GWF2_42_42]OGC78911.1 MAG: hypothetical protein A3K01_01150 [candidate division WWE3 bacterium RIFOXYD1_FULL_43_17]